MSHHRTKTKHGARLGSAVLLTLSFLLLFSGRGASAQDGTTYSATPTLIDGVTGITPDRSTPINAVVWAIESVDDLMLVGGAFTEVRDRSNFGLIPRPYLAAFDAGTGEYVSWWQTQPNGVVYDIIDLGDGRAALLGEFTAVNGVAGTQGFAVIDVATGMVDTSYSVRLEGEQVVRSGAVADGWLYLAGSFSGANSGGGRIPTGGLARISMATGAIDPGWTPQLTGGGAWAIDVAPGRVFVGGYFSSVNGEADTETLVALSPTDGSIVSGWNHGFPHATCTLSWRSTCGAVNGLVVYGDKVFVSGAKHFWTAHDVQDGTILHDERITNDGQSARVVDGKIVIGCHCSGTDEYIRVIDPATLSQVESPTINSEGGAGGWASAGAPDGCLWVGGEFSSTTVDGRSHPAWNLLRFCRNDGTGSTPDLRRAPSADTSAPTQPGRPTVQRQFGSSVDISWTASTDDSGQVAYVVYRNGKLVARTSGSSYQDLLLAPDAIYEWHVVAIDMAGNAGDTSARSAPIEIGMRQNVAENKRTEMADAAGRTEAELAIDGDTNGDLAAGSVARTSKVDEFEQAWWGIDLGQTYDIDYVEVFPRTDTRWTETNNRLRIAHDVSRISATTRSGLADATHPAWQGGKTSDAPRVEQADLATSARYLRFTSNSGSLALAEVRVMTVLPLATPPTPSADTIDPSAPRWKQAIDRGDNTVLQWGGAGDDRGVALYEIYNGGNLVGRTPNRMFPVGVPGQLARAFTIIAVDAAGNTSEQRPVEPGTAQVVSCAVIRNGATAVVSWVAASDPERFVVKRSVNGSRMFWRLSADGAERTATDNDRSAMLSYTVESRVGSEAGTPVACTDDDRGAGQTPDAPTGCEWALDGGAITVRWDVPDGASSVVIERRVDGGNWWWRGRVDAPGASYVDTPRTGTIDYRVKAKFAGGDSGFAACTTV